MNLVAVKEITDIVKGDTLIISGGTMINEPVKAHMVKVSETDGIEVTFDKKLNKYFNLGVYLKGESWVKEVKIVK